MTRSKTNIAQALVVCVTLILLLGMFSRRTLAEESSAESTWDREVDFGKLRTEYGDRKDYNQICQEGRPLQEMFDAADREDWQAVLEITDDWLRECPIDIDAHFLRAIAFDQTGDAAGDKRHMRWVNGLVDSILDSGTGASPDSAFVVIAVSEEYTLLRMFGLEYDDQATLTGDIDLLVAVDDDGQKHELFFSPEAHFRRLSRQIDEILGESEQ